MSASLAAALRASGLMARRSLGQHFLLDPIVNAQIARHAGPLAGRTIVEIGPGPGGLTRALLEAGAAQVIAIEKDKRFVDFLAPLVEAWGARLAVVEGDALGVEEGALLAGLGATEQALIIANLPYNVATPLLVKWLKAGPWRGAMTLMFQHEVAERIVAAPGDSAYGRLAVLAQSACAVRIVMTLPPGAFTPAPKVSSAVVRLDPLPAPFAHLDALERVTQAAFGQRRKMLRSSLRRLIPGDVGSFLARLSVDARARAETLSVAQFIAITEALKAAAILPAPDPFDTADAGD